MRIVGTGDELIVPEPIAKQIEGITGYWGRILHEVMRPDRPCLEIRNRAQARAERERQERTCPTCGCDPWDHTL